jgi:hypothetical protein
VIFTDCSLEVKYLVNNLIPKGFARDQNSGQGLEIADLPLLQK